MRRGVAVLGLLGGALLSACSGEDPSAGESPRPAVETAAPETSSPASAPSSSDTEHSSSSSGSSSGPAATPEPDPTGTPGSPESTGTADGPGAAEPSFFNESDIADHLGLNEDGEMTAPDGTRCEASVVLTDAAAVSFYADGGNVVATNPAGTAGVHVTSRETQTCLDAFTEALSDFP